MKTLLLSPALLLLAVPAVAQSVSNVRQVNCLADGTLPGICDLMTVSAPGVADVPLVMKIITPSGASSGTVTLQVGDGGTNEYEKNFLYGESVVEALNFAGFTTVELIWPAPYGWEQGPGGLRALSLRYLAALQWIVTPSEQGGGGILVPGTPMCHTGNSAGAAIVAYNLAYSPDADKYLDFAEFTSGPAIWNLNVGCEPSLTQNLHPQNVCNTAIKNLDYYYTKGSGITDINPAEGSSACSEDIINNGTADAAQFNYDSVFSTMPPLPNRGPYHCIIIQRLGTMDNSTAVVQANGWFREMTGVMQACSSASHALPNSLAGANDIIADLIGNCKISPRKPR